MQDDIRNTRNEFLALLNDIDTPSEIEDLRASYLGKNGKITKLVKGITELPVEHRATVGALINETMKILEVEINTKKDEITKNTPKQDKTIPGIEPEIGHTHLISQAIEEIAEIFANIGFVRLRYPEVEWDYFAFEALNFEKTHPARDNWETFWVDTKVHKKFGPMLLTPHTSSGQVREMMRTNPPIRMINISKTYRRQLDASHTPMFHQFEGLVVDENINITHLKGTIDYFIHKYFGKERKFRLRPHNFPFTEPSFEVDISCDICEGAGCKVCKQGWLELAGAGMVHPNVLKHGGIDPKKYSAFAFGTGVERVLMMRGGIKIPDLRMLYSADLRFLRQF